MTDKTRKILGIAIVAGGLLAFSRKGTSVPKNTAHQMNPAVRAKLEKRFDKIAKNSVVKQNPNWDKLSPSYADKLPEKNAAANGKDVSVTSEFRVIINPATSATIKNVNNAAEISIDFDVTVTNLTDSPEKLYAVSINSTEFFGGQGWGVDIARNMGHYPDLPPGVPVNAKFKLKVSIGSAGFDPNEFLPTLAMRVNI